MVTPRGERARGSVGRSANTKKSRDQLETYTSKRDFKKTLEPKPRAGKKQRWRFAVQKHDARRLHFDLRLELDGVLKSWAVTRGPSLVPGEKRLAIQTEDHPLDYLTWEGVIPKGEYGGGTMMVWDQGTWAPEADPERGLKKGHLDFTLKGKRLKGRWHLVRMHRKPGEKKDPWLLIKSQDEHARPAGDVEIVDEELTSARTGRTNEELATKGTVRADHAARAKIKKIDLPDIARLPGAKKGILPVFIEPCLAGYETEEPAGDAWIHEIKYDGYRMQARIDGGKVKLLTRKGLDWTNRFRTIEADVKRLPIGSALIDGEIVVQDENGVSSFSGLQADLKAGRKERLAYFVFDLLYLEGSDIRNVALEKRKELLQIITSAIGESRIRYSDHMEGDGTEILGHACRMGLEGIISKRKDSPYRSGRAKLWLKSKCTKSQEFIIIGYVPSSASDRAIGSLVLGAYQEGKLIHVGRAGTGFSETLARDLMRRLKPFEIGKPKLGAPLLQGAGKDVRWVKPELVAEIEVRGWTNDKLLRQASFKGLREDKEAGDVVLETVQATPSKLAAPRLLDFRLTHPDRVYWPDEGITKQALAEFYIDIADWILPHITGRVLSLLRCPSGGFKSCFYAKHVWQGMDEAIIPVDVGDAEPMLAIKSLEGLIALVQSGTLEIHPWGSKIDTLEHPDQFIIDLDPGPGVSWQSVIDAALDVRDRLQRLKLKSFVKTSGGKGLHVVTPIAPVSEWDTVKDFTKALAEQMATDSPSCYVSKMTKSIRRNRIFVDYLRNGRGQTAVAAYSTRARPGAAVSTPLEWSELSPAIGPAHFTVENLRQRLQCLKRDPWAGFFKLKQKLP